MPTTVVCYACVAPPQTWITLGQTPFDYSKVSGDILVTYQCSEV